MPDVKETIKVAAIFAPQARIRPVWFEWRRVRYAVRETTYFWKDRSGESTRLHFAVSDGCNLFELIYHVREQLWTMGGIDGG